MVLLYINMNLPRVYTCSPSWTLLPPPSPYHPSGSSQCTSTKHPVSCIKPGLAIHFIYDIIHVSMPFSQIIPPSPSPTESQRLFLLKKIILLEYSHFKILCPPPPNKNHPVCIYSFDLTPLLPSTHTLPILSSQDPCTHKLFLDGTRLWSLSSEAFFSVPQGQPRLTWLHGNSMLPASY